MKFLRIYGGRNAIEEENKLGFYKQIGRFFFLKFYGLEYYSQNHFSTEFLKIIMKFRIRKYLNFDGAD